MGRFPLLHNITVVPHEGGHMIVHGFFNFVSPISGGADEKPMRFPRLAPVAIAIAGTLGQLLAFAAPAAYFWYKKSPTPLGFFLFCLFGNFVGIGIYMMDCRIFTLDYVSYGEVDYENIASLHDWATIFNLMHWNLGTCEAMGRFARVMGWVGMAATAFAWMPFMYRRTQRPQPAQEAEPTGAMLTSPHEPRVPGGSEALLLVEKDQSGRQRLAGLLRHKGYGVLEAGSLQEAMRKATARPRPVQLVIARFSGAEASGPQVVAALRAVYPLVKALFLMGPGDPPVVTPDIPAADFLREPFDQNAVAMKVREVLDTPAPGGFGGH
jgi:CheY-like chemotaxis protein